MSADDARAEAEHRWPDETDPVLWRRARERERFIAGAQWQASRPFTEEDVEAAAKAIYCTVRGVAVQDFEWPEWVDAEKYRAEARAALDAVTARHTKEGNG